MENAIATLKNTTTEQDKTHEEILKETEKYTNLIPTLNNASLRSKLNQLNAECIENEGLFQENQVKHDGLLNDILKQVLKADGQHEQQSNEIVGELNKLKKEVDAKLALEMKEYQEKVTALEQERNQALLNLRTLEDGCSTFEAETKDLAAKLYSLNADIQDLMRPPPKTFTKSWKRPRDVPSSDDENTRKPKLAEIKE